MKCYAETIYKCDYYRTETETFAEREYIQEPTPLEMTHDKQIGKHHG